MNLSPGWVAALTAARFETLHWSSVGPGNAQDQELMRWAAEHGYVVVTCDLDFGAVLAASQGRRPSVVQLRSENLAPSIIGSSVISAIRQTQSELEAGAIVSVDAVQARLRILPLGD